MGKIRLLLDCSHIPGGTLCLYSIRICPPAHSRGRERACRTDRPHDAGHPQGCAECTAPGLDFDDAVQEGLIGLFHAVRGLTPLPADLHGLRRGLHPPRAAGRPPGGSAQKHAPLNYSVPLPAAEESTDTRPGPEELAIFGEQYADTPAVCRPSFRVGTHGFNGRAEGRTPRRPRGAGLPAKTWQCGPCALLRPQPRIQAICLRHISTCPQ